MQYIAYDRTKLSSKPW